MSQVPSCLRWPALIALAALCLTPSPSRASKGCAESALDQLLTPPAALWGELQPAGVIMNSIGYNGNQLADSRYPQFTSVDIENHYLFGSYWAGFGIWDLTDPENPVKLSLLDGWLGAFPQWSGISEIDQFIYTLDAPQGDDTLLAVGGISPMGLSIWDTRNKSAPVALYQDAFGKEISQVYAATINARAYAFAGGAFDGGEYGLFIYDMTEARNRNYQRCVENISGGVKNCPGVYVGKIGTGNDRTQYVHGLQFGNRHFIALSPGPSSTHFLRIWDVTNPQSPVKVVEAFTGTGLANFTSGVALWQQGNSAYLAVRLESFLQVFDVTGCLTNGCAALPGPIVNLPVATLAVSDNWKTVVFSRAGNTPMVTYSVPFYRQGKFSGVVTADLSIEYFRALHDQLVDSVEPGLRRERLVVRRTQHPE